MSLFQVREWWGVKGERGDEFTSGALVVGNVDNDASGQVKIVTGSLNGVLRMYAPLQSEFKIEHLLLEEKLRHPILQLALGRFVPNHSTLALAVLHPRRVSVYTVEGVGGSGLAASYFKLSPRYEHLLGLDGEHFTAFNMFHGPFGSAASARSDRDHLCVQSLDGRLQFFEQDRFAFLLPLTNSFVPGAVCYAPGMDAVVAATSDLQLECYRYQVLASASLKQKKMHALGVDEHPEAAGAKPIHCEWRLNLGEPVLDIRIGRCFAQETASSFDVLVLGEATLFGIRPHGEIYLQKRLGFHPSAMCLYPRAPAPSAESSSSSGGGGSHMDNVLLASHSKLWTVFKDKTLIWSACPSTVPVALHVADFAHISGMVVSLDADGALSVNYMGTDPPSTSVVAADTKEVNYDEMDEEHRQLLNVIRRAQGERRTEPKDRVLVRAQVPTILDAVPERRGDGSDDDFQRPASGSDRAPLVAKGVQLTMRIYVTYTGTTRVSNVSLSIRVPENVVASASSLVIASIDGAASTPLIIPVVLRPNAAVMPTSLDVLVSAAYTLATGQPRVSQTRVKLPMCLVCRLVPPVKASTFKFTLETNHEPLELARIFDDMVHQPFCTPEWAKAVAAGAGANVLSFQYYNGVEATILVSKNAGRYRIQSTELEALWMVSSELVARLKAHVDARSSIAEVKDDDEGDESAAASGSGPGLEVFYQEPLPLADFFGAIDAHFALRREQLEVAAELNDRAHQFRVIQKRLLVRYKDRNPAAIHCLDVLLHGTYEQLIALAHRAEDVDARLLLAANRLSCCVHLVLLLIRFRFHLDDANARLLQSYLSPVVAESGGGGGEQGWEERTDCAMTELLRTLLAKQPPSKDAAAAAAAAAATSELPMAEDVKKLKKHITIVCDRLGKGATLTGGHRAQVAVAAAGAKGE
ncbi:hypothetical protein PybrP1_003778 [[Pythium] brassicae (nom. inval.)]|nr:hypothetical protein PybrP1_003778 [[Pythium] brassicae (nom. inval.)]